MSDVIFYAPQIKQTAELPEQESRHCVRVLRMRSGESLKITDGKGGLYEAALLDANPQQCTIKILKEISQKKSWNIHIHIAFAPTKSNDRTEWFVEKATEIGVDIMTPLNCRFSERKSIKLGRLQKVAIAAMKQSQKAFLPKIDEMWEFENFILQPFNGQKFIAHCYDTDKTQFSKKYHKNENALILIGPEGDFSEEEVQKAIKNGFQPISLGEERLRTETACLVATHTIHVINNL